MKIVWTPLAADRLQEIADYIALDKPDAAHRWVESTLDRVEALSENPEIGRVVPEFKDPGLRELLFGNYRVIYRAFQKQIVILTVRNFKQLLPSSESEF